MTSRDVLKLTATLRAADGVRVAAESFGDGPYTFVILHGFTHSRKDASVRGVASWFARFGRVVLIDQRGHGDSGGASTLGLREPMDVDAAVAWARSLGDGPVVTVGFSMGAASVIRHAALAGAGSVGRALDDALTVHHQPDALISVSGVAECGYDETPDSAKHQNLIGSRRGRLMLRVAKRTRVDLREWPSADSQLHERPIDPVESAERVRVPLLVVQGDSDSFFPAEHGMRLHAGALAGGNSRAALWVESGMKHAERATTEGLVARIALWLDAHFPPRP